MKPILLAGLLSVLSLNVFAADYQCSIILKEDLKVLALEVKGMDDLDYNDLDPSLILNQEVLNQDYFDGDYSKLDYAAYGNENGNTKVLYTKSVEVIRSEFSFSDDLSKAFKNPSPDYEHRYSLQVTRDGKASHLGFSEFNINHLDKVTYPNYAPFSVFGFFGYDSKTDLYSAGVNLSRMVNIMAGKNYESSAKVYFSPGQELVYLENHLSTGYHSAEDYQDTNMGSGKSDDLTMKCLKL